MTTATIGTAGKMNIGDSTWENPAVQAVLAVYMVVLVYLHGEAAAVQAQEATAGGTAGQALRHLTRIMIPGGTLTVISVHQ